MRHLLLVAALTAFALASYASAQITAFWQPVTITPQAIANDPQLANMQCWDLMTTTSGNWASASMRAVVPSGLLFYKHPLGGLTRPDPALFGSSPALEFTTFASAATDDGTNHTTLILGGHPQSSPPSIGDATSPLPGVFSMVWGNSSPLAPSGTYQIVRLTFPLGVLANVININDVGTTGDFSLTSQFNPDATTEIPDIPEPTAFGLAGVGILLAMRRRAARINRGNSPMFGLRGKRRV